MILNKIGQKKSYVGLSLHNFKIDFAGIYNYLPLKPILYPPQPSPWTSVGFCTLGGLKHT